MKGIFDAFKSSESKQREMEEEAELQHIKVRKEVEQAVYDSLMERFSVDDTMGLKPAASSNDPPTAILRNDMQAFSMWHRLPIRGESKGGHVVDYAIYRGTHRIANKANPDVVIECRQLDATASNRTDPRIVKDVVGLSVDLLPGMAILATNRELSEFAKGIAGAYGIQLLNVHDADAAQKIFEMIVSDKQPTREKVGVTLERVLGKIDTLLVRRAATPWGKKVIEERQERLKDRVLKELAKAKATPRQLARTLHTHEEFILNELYTLEREGKARLVERSISDQKENIWAALPAVKSTK